MEGAELTQERQKLDVMAISESCAGPASCGMQLIPESGANFASLQSDGSELQHAPLKPLSQAWNL